MSTETAVVPWANLGSSGLKISKFILGCMTFGSKEWSPWVEDDEEKIFALLKEAYDHGIRTFDTADCYSNGLSEIILGKFLKKFSIKRDKVVILTKCWFPAAEEYGPGLKLFSVPTLPVEQQVDFHNAQGLSRKHIMDSIEGSMRRLGTYIDVFQIHRYDSSTLAAETMKALNDCVEMGWTRYIGASSMRAVEFAELQHVAEKNGWAKFISMQSRYNLLEREDENEMNYYCDKTGVGLIPYFALCSGRLARPIPKDESELTARAVAYATYFQPLTKNKLDGAYLPDVEIINRVEDLANKKRTKMSCVALAWLVSKGANPIVGVSSIDRLMDLVAAADVSLTEEEIKYLEEPYKPIARVYI